MQTASNSFHYEICSGAPFDHPTIRFHPILPYPIARSNLGSDKGWYVLCCAQFSVILLVLLLRIDNNTVRKTSEKMYHTDGKNM